MVSASVSSHMDYFWRWREALSRHGPSPVTFTCLSARRHHKKGRLAYPCGAAHHPGEDVYVAGT